MDPRLRGGPLFPASDVSYSATPPSGPAVGAGASSTVTAAPGGAPAVTSPSATAPSVTLWTVTSAALPALVPTSLRLTVPVLPAPAPPAAA